MTKGHKLSRPIKVIAACGNGTAGTFAPEALRRIGAEVIAMDTELDYTFPKYNPNPEDLEMLHAMADAVREQGADLCLGFDGDGDRCGVVDDKGREIFADKIGVLLARDLSATHPEREIRRRCEIDRALLTDPVLKERGVTTDYWKTGHSYIKRRTAELGRSRASKRAAIISSIRRSATAMTTASSPASRCWKCWIAPAAKDVGAGRRSAQDLGFAHHGALLPRRQEICRGRCADEGIFQAEGRAAKSFSARTSPRVVTVNGVRVMLEDGTWGLVRASSNKPSLVVVVESPASEANMRAMFPDIDARLAKHPEVGEYDQKI